MTLLFTTGPATDLPIYTSRLAVFVVIYEQICHAVAASASAEAGAWPELLPAVVFAAQVKW